MKNKFFTIIILSKLTLSFGIGAFPNRFFSDCTNVEDKGACNFQNYGLLVLQGNSDNFDNGHLTQPIDPSFTESAIIKIGSAFLEISNFTFANHLTNIELLEVKVFQDEKTKDFEMLAKFKGPKLTGNGNYADKEGSKGSVSLAATNISYSSFVRGKINCQGNIEFTDLGIFINPEHTKVDIEALEGCKKEFSLEEIAEIWKVAASSWSEMFLNVFESIFGENTTEEEFFSLFPISN